MSKMVKYFFKAYKSYTVAKIIEVPIYVPDVKNYSIWFGSNFFFLKKTLC